MVTVTVNGEERQYPKGENLLKALLGDGHEVPHYCWHRVNNWALTSESCHCAIA